MQSKHPYRAWTALSALVLLALACGLSVNLGQEAAPTQAPFQLPTGIPASLASPTSPPTNPPAPIIPTVENTPVPLPVEPEVTSTAVGSEFMADVKDYYQRGYLPFENGQMHVLDDFSRPRSSINILDFAATGQQPQNFALWADIVLNTTGSTRYPDYTGCGFAYRVQNRSEGYTAILTNEAVRMGSCSSGLSLCTLFGTTHGTGVVDVPNGSKAKFSLAVNKDHAWVLVNDMLAGQYTLYTTKLLGTGDLFYATVSNINAGYFTACQISNVRLWESAP
jgi:hypothetical protein